MKVKLDEHGHLPVRAHSTDAGLDIKAPVFTAIRPRGSAIIRTGVHVEIPHGCAGLLVSKSGLLVWNDITSTGLIDEGYTGEIVVKLMNHSDFPYTIAAGDKISQLVIIPVRYEDVELVDDLGETDRGDHGFGSTGL